MHSSSRRAFLRGRKIPKTPWEQFCQRLRRTVTGTFVELEPDGAARSGHLTVQHTTDIHHVRALCREYGVVLGLEGLSSSVRPAAQYMVWVRPGENLARLDRIAENSNRWFVQAGCTLGDLSAAGLGMFRQLPPQTTVAAWLADRALSDYATGCTFQSGLEHASMLLGDGQVVSLGPFSVHNTRPLKGLRLQQLVPTLFRLASGADTMPVLAGECWPGRYRLDALMAVSGQEHNLAHLCLGHGGELGWIEWVVIDADTLDLTASRVGHSSTEDAANNAQRTAARALDRKVKGLFDPDGVFSDYDQDL